MPKSDIRPSICRNMTLAFASHFRETENVWRCAARSLVRTLRRPGRTQKTASKSSIWRPRSRYSCGAFPLIRCVYARVWCSPGAGRAGRRRRSSGRRRRRRRCSRWRCSSGGSWASRRAAAGRGKVFFLSQSQIFVFFSANAHEAIALAHSSTGSSLQDHHSPVTRVLRGAYGPLFSLLSSTFHRYPLSRRALSL